MSSTLGCKTGSFLAKEVQKEEMRLNAEHKQILDGKRGKILQQAMIDLVNYGTAMGAEEFVPITSAHTSFWGISKVARCFPPRRRELTGDDIAGFKESISSIRVKPNTTVNPGLVDLEKWRGMGSTEATYTAAMEAVEVAKKCGILSTFSCIPYLVGNAPTMGEHCSWCETSAIIYCNSILGARTNRESHETSLYSALLGITPKYGMHFAENRKGTHLIDVQCEIENLSDWGALGYFTGHKVGVGIPVFTNLKRPIVEEVMQLGAAINVPGSTAIYHIPGVTPEAPNMEAAFGTNAPEQTYVFDEAAKRKVYEYLNHEPEGKVDLVFLGCPHATLYQIRDICRMIEGKHVAKDTRLWIMTSHSIRASADRLGYGQIIEASGGELYVDGCLLMPFIYAPAKKPRMDRVATDSVKQAFSVRRSYGSRMFFGNTERCIEIAITGGV